MQYADGAAPVTPQRQWNRITALSGRDCLNQSDFIVNKFEKGYILEFTPFRPPQQRQIRYPARRHQQCRIIQLGHTDVIAYSFHLMAFSISMSYQTPCPERFRYSGVPTHPASVH